MNRTVYIIQDNIVRPYSQHQGNMVYLPHEDIIEQHGILALGAENRWAIAWVSGKYLLVHVNEAIRMVATGESPIVCIWSQKLDENYGPIGHYIILEA